MVVYVTYRVPVEVELEIETGEIVDVHIMDEKLEGPLGVFDYELQPIKGRLKKRALELVEVAEWPAGPSATDPQNDRSRPAWSRSGPCQVLPPNEQGATGRT